MDLISFGQIWKDLDGSGWIGTDWVGLGWTGADLNGFERT